MGRDWGKKCIDKENGKYVTMMVVQEHSAQKKNKNRGQGRCPQAPAGAKRPGPRSANFSFL